ncbi:MAG: sigma-70 family RNA polymerase sigma factor [Myxococcales bacterium]
MHTRSLSIPWPNGRDPQGGPRAESLDRDVRDLPSVEQIYSDYAGFVWRVLRGMGIAEDVIQDAVQDVFVVVQRRLSEFDHRYSVKTWLFEIAYRVACSSRRSRHRTRLHEPTSELLQTPAPSPQEATERLQSSRLLTELLDTMDDERRVVLVLSDIEGLSAKEISELTQVNINTVYSRLRRAREELSRALAARGWRRS